MTWAMAFFDSVCAICITVICVMCFGIRELNKGSDK